MPDKRIYRSKFRRILELDRRIRDGEYPNATSFAREWEVNRKTITRDIDFLRYSLGAPVEFDRKQNGFCYTDPTWSLPHFDLTEAELLQLLLAERMAGQYKGTPLARTLESLFEKLHAMLPDTVSVDPVYLRAQVSFHEGASRPISEDIWIGLFQALRARKVVCFWYKAVQWRKAHTREVEPLHLACIMGEWYLVCYDREMDDLRHFAVSRIQSIQKVTNEGFEPRDFDPEEYFSNRFGRYVGKRGEVYKIKIRFEKDSAQWIEEREWHPEQKIQRHQDGTLTLSFPVPSLYEAKRWVLQWGGDATVLKPAELKQSIEQEIKEMTKKYR